MKTFADSGGRFLWHEVCKSVDTVSLVVNNRVMVHPSGREIGRMFSLFGRPFSWQSHQDAQAEKLTQSACGSSLPLVDESNLSHITRLGIRSFIRIAQTHAESQFISFGEIQPLYIWLAQFVVGQKAYRTAQTDGAYSK